MKFIVSFRNGKHKKYLAKIKPQKTSIPAKYITCDKNEKKLSEAIKIFQYQPTVARHFSQAPRYKLRTVKHKQIKDSRHN